MSILVNVPSNCTSPPLGERDFPGGRYLIVAHADRFEVFGTRGLSVHVVEAPTVSSVEGELLVEHLVDVRIPEAFRQLHWPNCRRVVHVHRSTTPADLVRRAADVELLRVLDGLTFASTEVRQ